MKLSRMTIVATMAAFAAAFGMTRGITSAQQVACLHGENETQDQVARRQAALGFTRHINTMEFALNRGQTFAPLDQLQLTESIPQGFAARLLTDGKSYAFSVKDTLDRCGFAYFSDSYQDGRIYVGQGIR